MQVSFEQLLDAFWNSHDPTADSLLTQYRSVIFYHNESQKTAALESMAREEERLGREILTAVIPYATFYQAEDYHQKYNLRDQSVLFHDISSIYPEPDDLMNSTAAARLNGYSAGYGNAEEAQANIGQLGLSEEGKQELLRIISRGLVPVLPASK